MRWCCCQVLSETPFEKPNSFASWTTLIGETRHFLAQFQIVRIISILLKHNIMRSSITIRATTNRPAGIKDTTGDRTGARHHDAANTATTKRRRMSKDSERQNAGRRLSLNSIVAGNSAEATYLAQQPWGFSSSC